MLTHCGHLRAPSGQNLMDIALVADIKENLVFRCFEYPVKCDR